MAEAKLKPTPQSLYPCYHSLDACLDALSSQLPIHQPNQLKSALMSFQNTLLKELDPPANGRQTVEELAEAKYPGRTYDTALPQLWVDKMNNRGFDPRGHFITMYPGGSAMAAYMAPITPEGIEMAAIVATYEA